MSFLLQKKPIGKIIMQNSSLLEQVGVDTQVVHLGTFLYAHLAPHPDPIRHTCIFVSGRELWTLEYLIWVDKVGHAHWQACEREATGDVY